MGEVGILAMWKYEIRNIGNNPESPFNDIQLFKMRKFKDVCAQIITILILILLFWGGWVKKSARYKIRRSFITYRQIGKNKINF